MRRPSAKGSRAPKSPITIAEGVDAEPQSAARRAYMQGLDDETGEHVARVARIRGQWRAIEAMIAEGRPAAEVIQQIRATQQAATNLSVTLAQRDVAQMPEDTGLALDLLYLVSQGRKPGT